MRKPHTRVYAETVFELVEPDGTAPVDVTLVYETSAPHTVVMELEIRESHRPSVWALSRSMLAEGLLAPVGLGSVQITPATPEFVLLQLGDNAEQASLWMLLEEIEEFLESTYDAVPVGEEYQWLEVDTPSTRTSKPDEPRGASA